MVWTPRAPRPLLAAAGLVVLEGAAFLLLAVGLAVATGAGGVEDVGRAGFGVLIGVAAGLGLLRVALALTRVEDWSRAPATVAQLLLVPVGYTVAFTAEQPVYGVPVLVVCAGVLFLLFTPESRAAFAARG